MTRPVHHNTLKLFAKPLTGVKVCPARIERFRIVLQDDNGALHALSAARLGKACPFEIAVDRSAMSMILKFTPDRRERVIQLIDMAREYALHVQARDLQLCHSTEVTIGWGFGQTRHIVAFLKIPEVAALLPVEQLIAAVALPVQKIWWGRAAKHRRRFIPVRAVRLVA